MEFAVVEKDYKILCSEIYNLILKEYSTPEDLETQFPSFIVMFEFFRLLRGEAFTRYREPTPEYQEELYRMEDSLRSVLDKLKSQVDLNTEKSLSHFNRIFNDFYLSYKPVTGGFGDKQRHQTVSLIERMVAKISRYIDKFTSAPSSLSL